MDLDTFVLAAILLLAATTIAVALFKHFGLGSVLGLLVAGIIVGPHSPGPYVTNHVDDVRHFTELGVVLLAVFFATWAMHQAGLSMALGAFMMGMLLSGSRYRLQIQAMVEPYKGLLMSLFFVAVGMSIDLHAIGAQPGLFAQHILVILFIKVVVLFLLALAFGLPRTVASRVAFMLAQGGEFGFVLFSSAKALNVIDDTTFVTAIGVISISMLATPLLVQAGDALARRAEKPQPIGDEYRYHAENGDYRARVIIGGYGRVGHSVAAEAGLSGKAIRRRS